MSVNIESLINSIQNEPPIWNSSLNASEEEKELSWARICEAVGCDRVSKLKVQWSSIRSCFARELRLEKDSAKSGSGKRKRSIYKYTRNLDFLRPHMKLKALQENYNAPSNEEALSDMESSQKDVEEDTSDNIAVSGEESSIVEDRESSHKAELKNANVPTVLGPDKRKKRRQAAVGNIPSEVKSLTDMASSATKVLSQLANKNTTNNSRDGDADWDFCKLMYAKMKSIPDGDLKDELQLEIQRLILQTKKRSATQGMNPPASFGSQVSRSSSEPQGCAQGYPAQSYPNQAWSCNQDNYQPCGTYQQMLQDANSVNDQFHYMN